jgi:RNA polymerase sigma-70 factor (ECF subfamily)
VEELIDRAAQGDAAALDALVARHRPDARRTALGILGDEDSAEDVAQESMIRLKNALPGFRGDSELRTWVHRVALNLAYDHLRRRRRERAGVALRSLGDTPDPRAHDPHAALDGERARTALHAALERLPDDQREVLTLRFLTGLTYAEIARVTGAAEGTVASRIYRALKRLGTEVEAKHLEIVR